MSLSPFRSPPSGPPCRDIASCPALILLDRVAEFRMPTEQEGRPATPWLQFVGADSEPLRLGRDQPAEDDSPRSFSHGSPPDSLPVVGSPLKLDQVLESRPPYLSPATITWAYHN
jgi:hypothetical protein